MVSSDYFLKNERGRGNYVLILLSKNEAINNI